VQGLSPGWYAVSQAGVVNSDSVLIIIRNLQLKYLSFVLQVKDDYLSKEYTTTKGPSLSQETALQLCCLAMRHYFKDMQHFALDKKSNLEYIEKDVGLHKFLPKSVLVGTKQKTLRKLIQQNFKKCVNLSDKECMLQFFDVVKTVFRYDREKFQCALGVSLSFLVAFVFSVCRYIGIRY
jgi:focal adhesion kinase 1